MVDGDSAERVPDPPVQGWYPVPGKPEYQHYWNGTSWSSQRYWGIEPGTVGASLPVTGPQGSTFQAPPPPPNAPGSLPRHYTTGPPQYFFAIATMIGAPIFVFGATVIALAGFTSRGGTPVGILAGLFAVFFGAVFVRRPFMATARPDGSITFRAVLGSKSTTAGRISRIWLRVSGRAASWVFEFDGTRALLGDLGGKALARFVIERNPRVQYPVNRFR